MARNNTTVNLPTISELNKLPYEEFVSSLNILFESAPPLAKHLYYSSRPFTSYKSLITIAKEYLEIINAHPRLGDNRKNLSIMSLNEQGYNNNASSSENVNANVNEEEDKINSKLQELNSQYENKFGFKFVIFVNGRSRKELIPIIEEKIQNGDKDEELNRGLIDMMDIAMDRLKKLNCE
ncbi:13040_t:CDS:2 [Entrophospora sp. SA101]|nr:13040_t:CDS:2 [Entrophospora sp. SA101]CAJ0915050.1 18793_t:CDS:2 [Entrophospora sp. SA101]